MYETVKYSVKLPYGLTDPICSSRGVKQGCILSPLLFNLYINDIPNIFDTAKSDPIQVGNSLTNIIMYADDLVSKSKEGLQYCLNQLSHFCE